MALWGTFFSVAFLLAGLVGPLLLARLGLPSLFIAHAVYMGVFAVAAFFFVPSDAARQAGRKRRGWPSLRAIIGQHVEVYANLRSATPALCFACYTGMFLAVQTLTPNLAAPEQRNWLAVGMPLASIATTLLAGVLVQYWLSPFRLTALAFVAVILATLALHAAVSAEAGVLPVGVARMALVSLLPGAIYPMIPLLCRSSALQAQAYGAIAQLGNVGSVLGPPIFAAAYAALGPIGLAVPPLVLSICGIALASVGGRRFGEERQAVISAPA
jgi:MFS transporter, AAHS family, 3-hydroxyphenylpropionic acid transporter